MPGPMRFSMMVRPKTVVRVLSAMIRMIFLLPPSPDTLRQRLEGRDGTGSAAQSAAQLRLRNAAEEISRFVGYDYLVINESLAEAVEELQAIVMAERCRRTCRQEMGQAILDSFRASLGDSV